MNTEILQFFQNISWATVAGLFVYYVLKPLILMLVNKATPQNGRLNKLEKTVTNEYSHRFQSIEKRLTRTEITMSDIREKIGRIEGWHNHNNQRSGKLN